VVRATSLSGLPELVIRLGGDPDAVLRSAGIARRDVGRQDLFLSLSRVVTAVETAAAVTARPDFGRRLAELQGIEILGPVGVAARTAATVADALAIFENFLSAYSPGMTLRVYDVDDPECAFVEFLLVDPDLPPSTQSIELSLGVTLRVLRFLMGSRFTAVSVHLPHEPLTTVADYRRYYGCPPHFAQGRAGFTIRRADLNQPLRQDRLAHETIVKYLAEIAAKEDSTSQSVRVLVDQLLPSGTVTADLIARQLNLHPKALQRRLAAEGTTFAAIIEGIRRDRAARLLRDTHITMAHLARELGYAEQSVLTRSCRRWFGCGPAAFRKQFRS